MREECLDIKQIPEPDRQQAVVVATVRDENGSRQGIGAAINHNGETPFDPQVLIDQATRLALQRARGNTQAAQPQSVISPHEATKAAPSSVNTKKEYAREHNTASRSITPKQLSTLDKMAQERNQNLAEITNSQFGLQPDEISSQQANTLFRHFKNGS